MSTKIRLGQLMSGKVSLAQVSSC